MRLFDRIRHIYRPVEGVRPLSVEQVRRNILAMNDPDLPFIVCAGGADGLDLVADWKIEELGWANMFAAVNMRTVSRTLMRLRSEECEVRSVDQERSVEWRAGVGHFSGSIGRGRGQINRSWKHRSYGRREDGTFGKLSEVSFSTRQVKEPIQRVVLQAGWTWRGVSFSAL